MKRNSLTTAVIAGIAGICGFAGLCNAVDLNPDGLGQVLVYPYYTVNQHQDTMRVVDTSDVGKAVKVRFLEGYNRDEVLDFNLYLSPHDVWTSKADPIPWGDSIAPSVMPRYEATLALIDRPPTPAWLGGPDTESS